jgi:hypothetical protein
MTDASEWSIRGVSANLCTRNLLILGAHSRPGSTDALRHNSMKIRTRSILLAVLGMFIAFVVLDSLGIFDTRSYYEIPHGSHTHYRPKDCDPPLPVSQSPTSRPALGQKIDCQGQFVAE